MVDNKEQSSKFLFYRDDFEFLSEKDKSEESDKIRSKLRLENMALREKLKALEAKE